MSVSRGFPETLVHAVAELQARLSLQPSQDTMLLPRAVLIKPGDAAPEVFQTAYEALLKRSPSLPYTVLIPPYQTYNDQVSSKLVCCLGTDVHLLEHDGHQVKSTSFPVADISYVETGRVLLYSWIRVHWQTADSVAGVAELAFNTVTDYVLNPVVDWMRSLAPAADLKAVVIRREDFEDLRPINLKLANYSHRSVAPGDPILCRIYQPEVRVRLFSGLGIRLFRKRANPHIVILTEQELILIQDGAFKRFGKNAAYGGVWHFIPLDKIAAMSLAEGQDDLLTLSVEVHGGSRLEYLFTQPIRPELDTLIGRFEAAAKKQLPTHVV